MMDCVRANLHPSREYRLDLHPIQIGGPANFARNNVEHTAITTRLKDGKSKMESIVIAIIKCKDNGVLRQWPAIIKRIEQLVKSDRVILPLLEVVQLFGEIGRRYRQAHAKCRG